MEYKQTSYTGAVELSKQEGRVNSRSSSRVVDKKRATALTPFGKSRLRHEYKIEEGNMSDLELMVRNV